ncbi:hypothetical protein ATANTOWER_009724, partial [Ataeniobius toweri]|nr:hypothetical protein [Ataeniobius toweri]
LAICTGCVPRISPNDLWRCVPATPDPAWRRGRRRPWRSARSLPAQFIFFLTGSRERTRSHEELSSRCNLWQLEMDSDSGVALQPSHTGKIAK